MLLIRLHCEAFCFSFALSKQEYFEHDPRLHSRMTGCSQSSRTRCVSIGLKKEKRLKVKLCLPGFHPPVAQFSTKFTKRKLAVRPGVICPVRKVLELCQIRRQRWELASDSWEMHKNDIFVHVWGNFSASVERSKNRKADGSFRALNRSVLETGRSRTTC